MFSESKSSYEKQETASNLKVVEYKLYRSIAMIMNSGYFTTTKPVVTRITLFIHLPCFKESWQVLVFTVQTAFVAAGVTEPSHAQNMLSERQHLPQSPGGGTVTENPIRGGNTSELRTPNQGFALGLGCNPGGIQAGPNSSQRKAHSQETLRLTWKQVSTEKTQGECAAGSERYEPTEGAACSSPRGNSP